MNPKLPVFLIGLLLGAGLMWVGVAFWAEDTGESGEPAAVRAKDVRIAVLKHEDGALDSAECSRREWPADVWYCVGYPEISHDPAHRYRVTVASDGAMTIEDQGPTIAP